MFSTPKFRIQHLLLFFYSQVFSLILKLSYRDTNWTPIPAPTEGGGALFFIKFFFLERTDFFLKNACGFSITFFPGGSLSDSVGGRRPDHPELKKKPNAGAILTCRCRRFWPWQDVEPILLYFSIVLTAKICSFF